MEGFSVRTDWFFGWLWRGSWQGAIVIVLVLLVRRLLAWRLTPRWRHALWFLVVIRLALPGSVESRISLFNFFNPRAAGDFSHNSAATPATFEDQSASSSSVHSSASRWQSRASLRLIWLMGAVALSAYFLGSAARLGQRIRRQRPVTNEAVLNLLQDCKQEMAVFTPITLLETAAVKSPALLGFIRPRLLLPQGLIGSFSLPELRYVFLHELGHLKRGDILFNWVMALPLVFHWFNPLVWYAMNRMRIDGESACDAVALSHAREGENQPYGRTIIKLLERFSCPALGPGLAGILENQNQMKLRISIIARFKKTHQWPLLAGSLFAALALVTLTNARSQPSPGAVQRKSEAGAATASWRPRVITCSPQAGETEVDPGITELTVTFDRDMSKGMFWTGTEAENPPTPEGQQPYWRDRRTCVLPVRLEAGHYYRLEINSTYQQTFIGTDGRAAAQAVLYFTTQGASQAVKAKLTKPRVVSFVPPNAATDVDPNLKEIRVTFDFPMKRGYSWTGGGDHYPGYTIKSAYWIDEHTCVLPVALQPNHQYNLGINSSAAVNFQRADGGVPSDPVDYIFRTKP